MFDCHDHQFPCVVGDTFSAKVEQILQYALRARKSLWNSKLIYWNIFWFDYYHFFFLLFKTLSLGASLLKWQGKDKWEWFLTQYDKKKSKRKGIKEIPTAICESSLSLQNGLYGKNENETNKKQISDRVCHTQCEKLHAITYTFSILLVPNLMLLSMYLIYDSYVCAACWDAF